MPNRVIKESICSSDNLDRLSWFEEVFFYRLIVNCDDYGRMDGRPAILRARMFPLKTVTDKQIADALQSLRSAGIVDLYEVDGRPFLQMRTWERHQRIRNQKSKYPPPAGDTQSHDSASRTVADNCCQLTAEDSRCRPNPIQSESNPREDARARAEPSLPVPMGPPPNVLDVEEDELIDGLRIHREIEEAGRKAGVFTQDWDSAKPAARDEVEDFRLMLEYPLPWVLDAIERAREMHKASSRYVLGILKRYKANGKSDREEQAEREREKRGPGQPVMEQHDGKCFYEGLEVLV